MTTVFAPPLPVVVGHRGARRAAPENTPAAFAAAADRGATWVELDVRLSADGVPVVIHDPETPDGAAVIDLDVSTLLRAGVPDLEAVLRGLPPGLGADVEIKHRRSERGWDPDASIASACAPVVAACVGSRPLMVTSFDASVLDGLRRRAPHVPIGLLTGVLTPVTSGLERALDLGCEVLAPHFSARGLSAEGIAEVKGHGLEVMVWTVNGTWHARRLGAAGVDAICTDDVVGTVDALGRSERRD